MKVYLDDERTVPQGWVGVKNYDDFVAIVTAGHDITDISFDHDLGLDKTGYDCVNYLEMLVHTVGFKPCNLTCHSMNPIGKQRIQMVFRSILNKWNA